MHRRGKYLFSVNPGVQSTRRVFLAGLTSAVLGKFFSSADLLAGPRGEYRALVCIFLLGGNDANNMVIPYDEYDLYAEGRRQLAIPREALEGTLITPPSDGRTYGLHPALADPAGGWPTLYDLWLAEKLAIVVNVGSLIRPIPDRDAYRTSPHLYRPCGQGSHPREQRAWQSAWAVCDPPTGWGGRVADLLQVSDVFPMCVSVAGSVLFCTGRRQQCLVIPPAPTPPNQALILARSVDRPEGSALRRLLQSDRSKTSPVLVRRAAAITDRAIRHSEVLNRNPVVRAFPPTSIGNQLLQVAKIIALSQDIGIQRQIFFASLDGFDTHSGQGPRQTSLFRQMSQAMATFYDALGDIEGRDLTSQVTAFTKSEFSRIFRPNAGGDGTTHGWGAHHFIFGGAVRGGDFYGRFPRHVLDGPDDAQFGANAGGIWIPTTSVEQYAATLARWFGVPDTDLPTIFPNIGEFPTRDLGFMRPETAEPAK